MLDHPAADEGAGVGRAALRIAAAATFVGLVALLPFRTPAVFGSCDPAAAAPIAAQDDVAALLPADLWVAAEGNGLGAIANGWMESRLHQRLVGNAGWKKFEQTPEYSQLVAALGFAELVSGMKPAALAGALLGEQVAVGLVPDGDQPGFAGVVRVADADTASHLATVGRGVASSQGADHVKAMSIRGIDAVAIDGKLVFGAHDRLLLLATSERLFEQLAERAQASPDVRRVPALIATLRARTKDKSGETSRDGPPLLRFVADAKKIASTRPEGRLLPAKSDNFVGSMLAGDLVEMVTRADTLCAAVDAHGDQLDVSLLVPGDPSALPSHFRSFGHANAQLPLQILAPQGTVLTWSLRRDWAKFWEDRVELCDPATEKQFAELKQNLALFFGGKSLPDEVLPQIGEEILFVLARQTYPGVGTPPKVKYPAGAFVYRAKGDAAKLGKDFAVGVHSFVGLINLERAQNNKTPLLPFVEPFGNVTVYGGRCDPSDSRPADDVRSNVSPACCWVNDRIILSSSEELLHSLVQELQRPITGAAAPGRSGLAPAGCTSIIRVDGAAARALAVDDRDALISNAVLNDGKPQQQAETEIDLLCELLGQLSHATLSSSVKPDGMRVELQVGLTPIGATTPSKPAPTTPSGGPR